MDFKGKVILISGATGGMGSEIAKKLAKEECKLILIARREEKLKDMCEKFSSNKTECIYKKCDVSNKEEVIEAVKFAHKKYGRIDLAILTAGILIPNPIETMDSGIIEKSMKINFFGTVYFLESLFSVMKKQKTATIAVTSTLPDGRGLAGWGAYGASKAAISWLVESLRAEAKQKYNINLLTIKPGSVETPMIKDYHRPGSVTSDVAADVILRGIRKEKKVIQFPIMQVIVIKVGEIVPPFLYDIVPISHRKGPDYPEPEDT